jgi:hypothetical protein
MPSRVATDAARALQAVELTEGLAQDGRVVQAIELLRELIGQDFDVDEDGCAASSAGDAAWPDRVDGRPRDATRPQERLVAVRRLRDPCDCDWRQRAVDHCDRGQARW